MKKLTLFLLLICSCVLAQTRPHITEIQPVNLNTTLANIDGAARTDLMAITTGALTKGDGGEGLYWWKPSDISHPDGTLIVGNPTTTGRWIRQRPHLIGDRYGTSVDSTLMSLIVTDGRSATDTLILPQVIGIGENGLGAFSERETAGLFIQNTSHVPTMDEDGTGVTYTANTVTKTGAFAGKKLKVGMVVDTKHGGGVWPGRASGKIQSFTDDTITVGAWYAGGTLVPASYPTIVPADGTGFYVNANTKAWCIHTNLNVNKDDYPYAKKGVIMEAQVWNNSASATADGAVLGFDLWGSGYDPDTGSQTTTHAVYCGYRAYGNLNFGYVAQGFNDSAYYVTPNAGTGAVATPSYGFRDDSNSTVLVGNGQGHHDYFFRGLKDGLQKFTVLGASGYTNIGGNRNPVSTLEVDGSFATGSNSASGTYAAGAAVHTIFAEGGTTVNLPASTGLVGRQYVIKNISGSGVVNLVPNGVETIDAVSSYTISALGAAHIVTNGGGWWVTAKY